MDKKLLIVGAGDFQLPLIEKAARICRVVLAAPEIPEACRRHAKGWLLADVREKDAILRFAETERIDGVITDQTDIPVATVAYVAEKLGLPGIGSRTAELFTNKRRMRERMRELGLPLLPNKTVRTLEEALRFYGEIGGRVIIKPIDMQGSRGVQLCGSARELRDKFPEAQRWSSDDSVMVERFAEGREFVVEGMALKGRFRNLICGDTHYFAIPDAFSANRRSFPTTAEAGLRDRVLALNERIITGFGLSQGITHSEFIMDGDELYLLETAARGGGVFISSDLIRLSTGLDTETFLVNIALGRQEELPAVEAQRCCCGYMAFYLPDGEVVSVSGKEEVLALPYVHSNQLEKLYVGRRTQGGQTDKTARLALIVSAPTHGELLERMAEIRGLLRVTVNTGREHRGLIWE